MFEVPGPERRWAWDENRDGGGEIGVWAVEPRCVQAGGSSAGRGGSGRWFFISAASRWIEKPQQGMHHLK